jgi:pimeloyl-ACP methyl ester carboxylesterase
MTAIVTAVEPTSPTHAPKPLTRLTSRQGVTISYARSGDGPPLVLVHGAFSDHHTNWEFVEPVLAGRFTLYAVARRGRGATDATGDHSVEDEAHDVATVIESVGEPVFLLGHSHGAQCALAAASIVPARVRKLVLYEPPRPPLLAGEPLARLESLAAAGAWDEFAFAFFRDTLHVPVHELEALRASELWPPIAADAKASLGDLRAISRYDFTAERFRGLRIPVLLQVGTESLRELFATDELAAVLPDVRIGELPGQAHEGMTTAPEMYADAVTRFLEST